MSEGQALEVWAAPDEIGVRETDNHLADTWELGTFAFESPRDGTPVRDAQ